MKYFFVLTVLFFPFISQAQQQNNESSPKSLFIGANALALGFDLEYNKEPKGGNIQPYGSINIGYKLKPKLRLQAGIWYGTDNRDFESVYVEAEDKLIYYHDISRTRGIGVPITVDYVLLYPLKRLQFYATVVLTPIYSSTRVEKTEQKDGVLKVNYNEKASGFNTYLTGGFGLSYPLGRRLDTYFNYHIISRNFNRGLRPRDEYPYQGSLVLGLNYNFNQKREE